MQLRVSGTATRPWAYRLGTLTIEWQCKWHCHSALNVQSRAFTATWQYTLCQEPSWAYRLYRQLLPTTSAAAVGGTLADGPGQESCQIALS